MLKSLTLLLAVIVQPGIRKNLMTPADLGKSINVFKDYEFFIYASIMRWDDEDNPEHRHLPGENKTIFKENSYTTNFHIIEPDRWRFRSKDVGKRSLDVCHNLEELFEAYFRNVRIKRVPDKWSTFTRKWDKFDIEERFDIPQYCIRGENCLYILLKVSLTRFDAKIPRRRHRLALIDDVEEDLKKINDNSSPLINAFIAKYGTHYINHYATGITLYQVFVYDKRLPFIDMDLRNVNVERLTKWQRRYFSPRYATHIGEIRAADGNVTTEEWAAKVCKEFYKANTRKFPNLLNLHRNPSALREFLRFDQNRTVVELGLYPITRVIKNRTKRKWFNEVLNNHYVLFNENLEH